MKQVKLARVIFHQLTLAAGTVPPVVVNGHLCVYQPDRGLYAPLEPQAVRRKIMEYDGKRLPSERNPVWLKDSDVQGVMKLLMTLAAAVPLDSKPGVAFKDVFLGLDKGGLVTELPHSPANGAVFGLSHEWQQKPPPGFWHEALFERVWKDDPEAKEKTEVLAEFVGACLFGLAPVFKKACLLYGSVGDNGKSTIIDGIRLLFDNPPTVEPHLIGQESANAQLAFARINTTAELRNEDFPNPEGIKAAIAGDPLRARYLYLDPFTFTPVTGHLLAANNLPQCRDMTNAFWNRWLLLSCNRIIPPAERLPPQKLKQALAAAAPELAHWAVEGAARLMRQGHYTVVPSSVHALAAWRRKSDQFAQFIEEETVPGDGVELRVIYERYSGWASSVGHRRMSRSTFEERLRARGVDLMKIRMRFQPGEDFPASDMN